MKIVESRHPLVRHKLGWMRRADIGTRAFRELAAEVGTLLAVEATADLPLDDVEENGWAGAVQVQRLQGRKLTLVPVLRAGLGLLPGVLHVLPAAKVSMVGMRRNETTLEPEAYYDNLVDGLAQRTALVLDPMLATGGTLVATLDLLRASGCTRTKVLCLVAAPEGLRTLEAAHPETEVFTAAIDTGLNAQGYILPGLGDAGDRIFGTRPG